MSDRDGRDRFERRRHRFRLYRGRRHAGRQRGDHGVIGPEDQGQHARANPEHHRDAKRDDGVNLAPPPGAKRSFALGDDDLGEGVRRIADLLES